MKKFSLPVIGVLAVLLAAVLVVRHLPGSNPATGAAAPPGSKQTATAQSGGPAPSAGTKGDPDIFKKIVQRHDEQVRASGGQDTDKGRTDKNRMLWEKALAGFDDSMKEDPGVRKFGAKIEATFGPGETLVTTAWRTPNGKNGLCFVTPTIGPDGRNPDLVLIASRLIEVPDEVLDGLGIATLKAQANGANPALKFSSAQADALFSSMTKTSGLDALSSPRVMDMLGQGASISVGSEALIAGKQQRLGLTADFFPTRSADGSGLDIGMLVRYTVATGAGGGPESGQ